MFVLHARLQLHPPSPQCRAASRSACSQDERLAEIEAVNVRLLCPMPQLSRLNRHP
jgi:hypothetical protein